MATTYSSWSDTWRPSGSSKDKQYRARLDTTSGYNATQFWVTATVYVNINSSVEAYYKGRTYATSQSTYTSGNVTTTFKESGAVLTVYAISHTFYWNRTTKAYNVSVVGGAWSDKKSWDGYWMQTTQTFTVPALTSYAVTYDANGGNTGTVDNQTKYYGIALNLQTAQYSWLTPTGEDEYSFKNWNTKADGTGTTYVSGQQYTGNAALPLFAQWQATHPPTCDYTEIYDSAGYGNYTKNFSRIETELSNIKVWEDGGRELDTVTLTVGNDDTGYSSTTLTKAQLESADYKIYVTPTSSGTDLNVTLAVSDSVAVSQYDLGTVEVKDPTWDMTAEFDATIVKFPDSTAMGNTDITVYAEKYVSGVAQGTFDVITAEYHAVDDGATWSITVSLGEDYVDDVLSTEPNAHIKVAYNHTDVTETESGNAFFKTTRNANFSTGISNTMFVSGCEAINYSSRVWWSQINNPLYFPDTNYVEVGSNDTAVMGLCKVGDYLGVVKQSKTTDTAIFLIYPTSFEDDTTYAVKQLSSGIGAYGKYTFNVLGDETMFLSPNGVMAIVPSEDNDHKVQNRSYFIDKKLLGEEQIQNAYSFVFDGKYYLAVNDKCYVLDGNQRNSWGNDKTNLVYECYYLENVPADCFVKYNEQLLFSNDYGLCQFKKESDGDPYTDSYGGNIYPVKAKWSTLLDDDGALNYYKTMQKKGNLVSILPNTPFKFTAVSITEEEFNKDKTNYWIFDVEIGEYVRCTEESVFESDMQYYTKDLTNTKVYVRKDSEEPLEIKRSFNELTEIPSELFVNKKFKKYKRLQFILENNEAEPFGVDSIIKQYTVGNYAKR